MKRSSPSLQFFAVAANNTASSAAAMSSRPSFGGSGRGRGYCRRSYSDHDTGDGEDNAPQFVSGDSHFGQVRDTNRCFQPPNNRGSFRSFPPPPSYNQNFVPPPQSYNRVPPQSYNVAHPPPSYNLYRLPQQPFDQNQQFYRPPPPHSNSNQQFRPRWQHQQQQFRPSPPKDLEYRNWQYANPGPPPECERFTILSYNILADYLVRDHWEKLYFHIPRHFLDWERRKRSILLELGLWSADIMCLQEVDRFQDLKEELEHRGYSGIWKMRTGDPVDGCAIFWRNSRFKLLYEESIEFCKLGLRDNVAQICVFESLNQDNNSGISALTSSVNAKKLVVCNIHVLFNPKRGEIKLGQIRVLLSRANGVSKLWGDAPLILCGDFNSTPKSPLYNLIAEQKLDLSDLPRDKVSGQASAEIHLSRPFHPKYGAQQTEDSAQVLHAFSKGTEMDKNHPLDFQKPESPDIKMGNGPLTDSFSRLGCSMAVSNESPASMNNSEGNNDKPTEKYYFHGTGELKSNINIWKESASSLNKDVASSTSPVQNMISGSTDIQSPDTTSNCRNNVFSSVAESPCNSIGIPENQGTSLHETSGYLDRSPGYLDQSPRYDPSAWTPAEIETATGTPDCIVMEHTLKLQSVYEEVKDSSGTRGSSGEPDVTSYHRRFMGTVDYMWRSEGLQTARVLSPIPKHAMLWTKGFPTKKWGSDHIALVSELAFTEDFSRQNAEIQ